MEYRIDGHTIEFELSGSGSVDPWSSKYAKEIGVTMWCTSDMGKFALVDGDGVYKMKWGSLHFGHFWENSEKTWECALKWVEDNKEEYFGSLKEMKKDLDERKKKQDEYDNMTPEEREKYKAEWRAKRDEMYNKWKKEHSEQ